MPDVRRAVAEGRGFVLGEEVGKSPRTLAETSATARAWIRDSGQPPYVQDRVEADFVDAGLPDAALHRRGCAGFPRKAPMRERLLDFARRMTERHGDAWHCWGTEQITSNDLVANASGAQVLPYPRYADAREITADTGFVYFIGWLRHYDRGYERLTRQVMAGLAAARQDPAIAQEGFR